MDRSSGQDGRSGQSSSAYKVNVNRTKTKKWVVAPVQNYDGDDWGSSEEEPESPDEPPMPPRGPPPLSSSSRLPSDTRIPALRRPTFPIPSANPPLQETISVPNHPPVDSRPAVPSFAVSAAAETRLPDSKSPSNDSRRSPDEKIQTGPPATESRRLSFEQDPTETKPGHDASGPTLPSVTRMSTFGSDMFSGTSGSLKKQNAEIGAREDVSVSSPAPRLDDLPEGPSPGVVAPNPQRPSLPGGWVTETQSVDGGKVSNPSSMNSTPNITFNARPPPLAVPSSPPASETQQNFPHLPPPPASTAEVPSLYGNTESGDSSPIKKSDALSDEIMRSLSPGGLPTKTPSPPVSNGPQIGKASDVEDFLNNRGEVWGESSKQPAAPIHPPFAGGSAAFDRPSREQSPQVDSKQLEPSRGQSSSDHLLRNRFSWEKSEQPPAGPPQAPAPISDANVTSTSVESTTAIPDEAKKSISNPPELPISPTIIMVPGSNSPDLAAAAASSSNFNDREPSPGLEVSNNSNGPYPIPTAQSLEKEVLPPTPTTNDAHSVTFEVPREKEVMPLKEIVAISSPSDRLNTFQTTRLDIAMTDSGLNGWMAALMTVRPEHANANCYMSGAPASLQPSITHGSTGPGSMGSSQETGSGAGAKLARKRLAGLGGQAQAAAESAFGHGGNQIGHKSKEFMQSAGKMGKGLFSKGRSKLRGTGDKVFH